MKSMLDQDKIFDIGDTGHDFIAAICPCLPRRCFFSSVKGWKPGWLYHYCECNCPTTPRALRSNQPCRGIPQWPRTRTLSLWELGSSEPPVPLSWGVGGGGDWDMENKWLLRHMIWLARENFLSSQSNPWIWEREWIRPATERFRRKTNLIYTEKESALKTVFMLNVLLDFLR